MHEEAGDAVAEGQKAYLQRHAHSQAYAIKQHQVSPMSIGCLCAYVRRSSIDETHLRTETKRHFQGLKLTRTDHLTVVKPVSGWQCGMHKPLRWLS